MTQDSLNIVLLLIEWNALYMYKESIFKVLRYMYSGSNAAHP